MVTGIFSIFLNATADVLAVVLQLCMLILIARALISWVSPDPRNPIVQFLRQATDPVLWQLRRLPFPLAFGGFDFSVMAAILVVMFLQRFLVGSLRYLAGVG